MSEEFVPIRRRWFIEKRDYGREWSLVPVQEDAEGRYKFLELLPMRTCYNGEIAPETVHPRRNVMMGNENISSFVPREEVQQLMDALWEVGLRPTQR